MNSDILFEITKYVEHSGNKYVAQVLYSPETQWRDKLNISRVLENRLLNRPSITELYKRNIIKKDTLSFNEIRKLLVSRHLDRPRNAVRIAPTIAGRVNRLDFYFKRRIMINKLGIDEYEKIFK